MATATEIDDVRSSAPVPHSAGPLPRPRQLLVPYRLNRGLSMPHRTLTGDRERGCTLGQPVLSVLSIQAVRFSPGGCLVFVELVTHRHPATRTHVIDIARMGTDGSIYGVLNSRSIVFILGLDDRLHREQAHEELMMPQKRNF